MTWVSVFNNNKGHYEKVHLVNLDHVTYINWGEFYDPHVDPHPDCLHNFYIELHFTVALIEPPSESDITEHEIRFDTFEYAEGRNKKVMEIYKLLGIPLPSMEEVEQNYNKQSITR